MGGYFEQFMGTEGTIRMSENPALTKIYKENRPEIEEKWNALVADGTLIKKAMVEAKVADARESKPPQEYGFELNLTKPIHMPHLENFFNAIRGKEKLNCDGEHAFEAEAAVYKVNEAVEAKKMLYFKDEDFVA